MNVDEVVGRSIADARKRRRWSQQALLDQLAERTPGASMSRRSLVELEAGRRRATAAEVLALALALNVPPIALLLPPDDETLDLGDAVSMPARASLYWMVGLQAPIDTDRRLLGGWVAYDEAAEPVELRLRAMLAFQRIAEAVQRQRRLASSSAATDEQVRHARWALRDAGRAYSDAARALVDGGSAPTPVSRQAFEWIAAALGRTEDADVLADELRLDVFEEDAS